MLTLQNYREYPAIHYSLLSKIATDPSNLEFNNDNDGITFGDALDILLTQSEEEFDKRYAVAKVDKPTGQMGEFVEALYKLKKFDEAYETVGFKRDSLEKVVDRFSLEGADYHDFLQMAEGKKIISYEMYKDVLKAINTLKIHDFTSVYFNEPREGVEIKYQVPILFKVDGNECKALLDVLVIDHEKKLIYPIDLKSTGEYINMFPSSFLKWKYYLQASFYSYGVKQLYPDYTVDNFKFIVISSQQLTKPLVYTCTDEDLLVGEKGGLNRFTNKKVKGWRQLYEDYLWHLNNDLWEYPKEVYENNGEIELGVLEYEFEKKAYVGEEHQEE